MKHCAKLLVILGLCMQLGSCQFTGSSSSGSASSAGAFPGGPGFFAAPPTGGIPFTQLPPPIGGFGGGGP